jgi:hypothetical protein
MRSCAKSSRALMTFLASAACVPWQALAPFGTRAPWVDDSRWARRGRRRGILASLVRLGRVVLGSRDALSPYTAVTIALRPAILIASLFAALAAVVEIPASALTVPILALT